MDHLVYTAATGAKQLLLKQDTIAHNLANANTPGFRADMEASRSVPLQGDYGMSRVFAVESTPTANFASGPMQATGRNLDIAVEGDGWISVESLDGSEAYTRAGALDVGADGILRTRNGLAVVGEGGQISVPENSLVTIAKDGTVSVVAAGNGKTSNAVGRIKLVNPPATELVKGGDGLFRTKDGNPAPSDPAVKVIDGTIENSNVNAVEAMIGMISTARQFETQMRMITMTDQNSQTANKLLASAS